MANDILIRFIGQDGVTSVANKVTGSINKVTSSAASAASSGGIGGFSQILQEASGGLGGFGTALTGTAQALATTGLATGALQTAITAIGGPIGIAVIALGALAYAAFGVMDAAARTRNEVDNLRRGIITLAGSKEDGDALYSTLIDLASRTPFERRDIMEMGQALLATGVDAEKVPGYITAIGDAVSTIGGGAQGGAQKIDTVTRAIGKMSASGKISNEQMMILTENGIDGFSILAKEMNISKEEVMALSSEGLLPASKNLDLLIKGMNGKYGDAMAAQMGTATQSASNLNDAWQDLSAAFGGVVEPVVVAVYDGLTLLVQGATYVGQAWVDLNNALLDLQIGTTIVIWERSVRAFGQAWDSIKAPVIAFGQSVAEIGNAIGYFVSESQTVANVSAVWESLSTSAENTGKWISEAALATDNFLGISSGIEYLRILWNDIWAAAAGYNGEAGRSPVPKGFETLDETTARLQTYLSAMAQALGATIGVFGETVISAERLSEVTKTFGNVNGKTAEQVRAQADAMGIATDSVGNMTDVLKDALLVSEAFRLQTEGTKKVIETFGNISLMSAPGIIKYAESLGIAYDATGELSAITKQAIVIASTYQLTLARTKKAQEEYNTLMKDMGYNTAQLSQSSTQVSDDIVYASQMFENFGAAAVKTADGVKQLKDATDGQAEAARAAAAAQREFEKNTNDLDSTLNDLRGSYMDIADAQRSVESAQKALSDAMDPSKIEQMNLALQMQAIDMRDLNDSIADMNKRRDEIAKALAGMNEEQIKNNALTAAERRQLSQLNSSLDTLRKRREAVRKALAGNQLTDAQRVEFMQTEYALTAAINQQTDDKTTLEQKQKDALKKAQEDRVRLLEEDKKLQEDLEKANIRVQQAIISMTQSQQALADAQDPKRLEAYRDAVTKAELNLASLRAEQLKDKIAADELSATLGLNSESFSALAESASLTATPLDDIELRSGELTATLNGFDGTTALVGGLAGQMAALATDSGDAVGGVKGVGDALTGINNMGLKSTVGATLSDIGTGISALADANGKFATDFLSAPLQAVEDLANALNQTKADAFKTWANALQTAINAVTDTDKVKKLINTLTALANATSGAKNPLPYPGAQSLSVDGGGMNGSRMSTAQNITINLNYASAPSSKTPLKDVEDYLAAQGGRLRI